MQRILNSALLKKIGEEVVIAGYVDVRRDHGKMIFLDVRDRSGKVQCVVLPNHKEAKERAVSLRPEWVVEIKGKVNERPAKLVNANEAFGTIEVEVLEIKTLGKAVELPFEKDAEVNIDTHLDNLPFTLRNPKHTAIFKVQSVIVKAFRDFYDSEGFVEFQAPKLIGEDAEGGANSFSVEYFKHTAHLAQSPQLYKQIMVGVFERVYTVGNVYRAEKHSTTRHLNEYTSLDIEMGYIKDHTDVMAAENRFMVFLEKTLRKECVKEFEILGAEIPKAPTEIPAISLTEAQRLLEKETGKKCLGALDLDPEDERWLCEYSMKNFKSDYIFVTHFPTSKRPFYTYRDEKDPTFTKGFDLLFRGVEITTGAQRIHDYDALVSSMKEKNLNPEKFSYYLQAFKYGMPPHGGFGMGLERLTAKMLNIQNVKEATLFPRDINRIDKTLAN